MAEVTVKQATRREALGIPVVKSGESKSPRVEAANKVRQHAEKEQWKDGMRTGGEHGRAQTRLRATNALTESTIQVENMGYTYDENGKKSRKGAEKTNHQNAKTAIDTVRTYLNQGFESLDPTQQTELLKRVGEIISERPSYKEEWDALADDTERNKYAAEWLKKPEIKAIVIEQLEAIKAQAPAADDMDTWSATKNAALREKKKLGTTPDADAKRLNKIQKEYDDNFSEKATLTKGTDGEKLQKLSDNRDADMREVNRLEQRQSELQEGMSVVRSRMANYQKRNDPVPADLQREFDDYQTAMTDLKSRLNPLKQKEKDFNRLTRLKKILGDEITAINTRVSDTQTKLTAADDAIAEAERNIAAAKTVRDIREEALADALDHVIDAAVDEVLERATDKVITQWDNDLQVADVELASQEEKKKVEERAKAASAVKKRYYTIQPPTTEKKWRLLRWKNSADGKPHLIDTYTVPIERKKVWSKDQIDQDYELFFHADDTALEQTVTQLYTDNGLTPPSGEDMEFAKAQFFSLNTQARKLGEKKEPNDTEREMLADKPWFKKHNVNEAVKDPVIREKLKEEGIEVTPEEAEDLANKNPQKAEEITQKSKDNGKMFMVIAGLGFGGVMMAGQFFQAEEGAGGTPVTH